MPARDSVPHLDGNRDATPHASVNIARAAAPQQHPDLHLLKGVQSGLQCGALLGQGLPGLGVAYVTREGGIPWSRVVLGPGIAGALHSKIA